MDYDSYQSKIGQSKEESTQIVGDRFLFFYFIEAIKTTFSVGSQTYPLLTLE